MTQVELAVGEEGEVGSSAEAVVKAVTQGGSSRGGQHPLLRTSWAKNVREDVRPWLHPKIIQCSQRNNGWEPSGQAASLCLSFPRCKVWMKTLKGMSLLLGGLGASQVG